MILFEWDNIQLIGPPDSLGTLFEILDSIHPEIIAWIDLQPQIHFLVLNNVFWEIAGLHITTKEPIL